MSLLARNHVLRWLAPGQSDMFGVQHLGRESDLMESGLALSEKSSDRRRDGSYPPLFRTSTEFRDNRRIRGRQDRKHARHAERIVPSAAEQFVRRVAWR